MEIERKFVIRQLPQGCDDFESIEQTYVFAGQQGQEVRIRHKGSRYFLTIKGNGSLARDEVEFELTVHQFDQLRTMATGGTLKKRRAKLPVGSFIAEVDVFEGALDGLMLAEVEFPDVQAAEAFIAPSWFGPEVTYDKRFKNRNLAAATEPPGANRE